MALLDFVYNRPNRVLQLQKQYQADPRPIYLRPAGAKATLMTYGVVFGAGMLSTTYGIVCLITGYGKK
ncbi:hypothetical protein FB45DRAFT_900117 [Roridomyces roridus]|uniref:Uncharacterized protein n=1 Tax=Roridomyces roridus TaxID=1738132 RepID=A0AAD7FW69_9AGAR|nr:hypothetical protein FB45DRAFT_900117 [Roridomyces roridus]